MPGSDSAIADDRAFPELPGCSPRYNPVQAGLVTPREAEGSTYHSKNSLRRNRCGRLHFPATCCKNYHLDKHLSEAVKCNRLKSIPDVAVPPIFPLFGDLPTEKMENKEQG